MSEASAAVLWLLQQAEPEARRVAVSQIGKVRDHDAPELLLRALGDDDWRVRKEAAAIAATLECREEVVAALVASLEETLNIGLRNAAVEALIAIGSDALGATIESLPRLDADARKLAVEVLAGIPDPLGTTALSRALSDEDVNVRAAAAEALGNAAVAGEESRRQATEALVGTLVSSDAFLKIAALESLVRLEAMLPWSVFEPCARDPLLRRYAIAVAARSREPEAIRALAHATADPSTTIAREAIIALGDLVASEHDEAAIVDVVRGALQSASDGVEQIRRFAGRGDDTRLRGAALLLVGLLRIAGAMPALVDALSQDELEERADLAVRLFGPSGVAPLLAAARLADSQAHGAALALAGSLAGAERSIVVDALRDGLRATSPDVLLSALEAIGSVGEAEDLARLAVFIGNKDERIAATASNALSQIAARYVDDARTFLHHAETDDPLALACVILGAIATIRELSADDVRSLERALAHPDPRVRRAAVDALAQAGGDAAADAVGFALADEENEVKLAAVRALGRLGRADPLRDIMTDMRDPALAAAALRAMGEADPEGALRAARPMVSHTDPAVACAAVEAIGHLASSARLSGPLAAFGEDAIFAALDHPDPEVVKLGLSLLGAKSGPRALARLGMSLDHTSWEVRRVAAELLGQDKSPGAQALLRARFEREKDPIVREAISSAVTLRPQSEGGRLSERGD